MITIENVERFISSYNEALCNGEDTFTVDDFVHPINYGKITIEDYKLDDMKKNITDVLQLPIIVGNTQEQIMKYIEGIPTLANTEKNYNPDINFLVFGEQYGYPISIRDTVEEKRKDYTIPMFRRRYISKTGISQTDMDEIMLTIKTRMWNHNWVDGDSKEKILYDIYKLWYFLR